jgi:hypothetical protein
MTAFEESAELRAAVAEMYYECHFITLEIGLPYDPRNSCLSNRHPLAPLHKRMLWSSLMHFHATFFLRSSQE